MHEIQRSLIGYVVENLQDIAEPVGLMAVQGTSLLVPVLDAEGVPAARRRIGWPDCPSGLVVADLETDEAFAVLSREGVGVLAGVTWDAGWHRGDLQAHTPDLETALATLAAGLQRTVPCGAAIAKAAAPCPADWPRGERRDVGDRISVTAPTDAARAMALIEWEGMGGDVFGSVLARPYDDWTESLTDALDQVRPAARQAAPLVDARRSLIKAGPLRLELRVREYGPTGPRALVG